MSFKIYFLIDLSLLIHVKIEINKKTDNSNKHVIWHTINYVVLTEIDLNNVFICACSPLPMIKNSFIINCNCRQNS